MIPITKLSGRLGNQMFQLAYLYQQVRKGEIPDIYVQDPKYIDEETRQLFKQGAKPNDYVVIHVRRGDYVDNPFYVDLMKTDYYQKAMAMFPDADFVVISDDPKWCYRQEVFKRCLIANDTEINDLNLMIGAKSVITANSSFSWWGAYLSEGKVVAPKAWYTDGVERTKCPEHWIRI